MVSTDRKCKVATLKGPGVVWGRTTLYSIAQSIECTLDEHQDKYSKWARAQLRKKLKYTWDIVIPSK